MTVRFGGNEGFHGKQLLCVIIFTSLANKAMVFAWVCLFFLSVSITTEKVINGLR